MESAAFPHTATGALVLDESRARLSVRGWLLARSGGAAYRFDSVGKRRYRRQEQNLLRRVEEHTEKIRAERSKRAPDERLIAYWERELRAFEAGITRARQRQGRRP